MQGNNPYDSFRKRNVLTDLEFLAGGSVANEAMLKYTWEQLGGGIIHRFSTSPAGEVGPIEKLTQKTFVLSNIIGRFIRVSNYGETEKLKEIKGVVQQEEARQQLADKDAVNKGVRDAIEAGATTPAERKPYQDQVLIDVFGKKVPDPEDLARANNLMKNFRLGIVRGTNDPAIAVLIGATSNAQKIAIMKSLRGTMPLDEYTKFAKEALNEGVISPEVVNGASKP